MNWKLSMARVITSSGNLPGELGCRRAYSQIGNLGVFGCSSCLLAATFQHTSKKYAESTLAPEGLFQPSFKDAAPFVFRKLARA
jgi:hypothetical protein